MKHTHESYELQVSRPCPFVPSNRKRNDQGFYCKSCSKTVVDFRDKTNLEIIHAVNNKTCGVFYSDQLVWQKRMNPKRKVIFQFLMLFSILGFSIGPISAQTDEKQKDSVTIETIENKELDKKKFNKGSKKGKVKTRRRGLFRRKKKDNVIIGCPSF